MNKKPVGKRTWKLSQESQSLLKELNDWRNYPDAYRDIKETATVLDDINNHLINVIRPKTKRFGGPLGKFYGRITQHAPDMDFQFDGGSWIPSGKTIAAHWWAKASVFYMDVASKGNAWKNIKRLKECKHCSSLFWDGSVNRFGKYCDNPKCSLEQIKANTAEWRRRESKKTMSK